ncbi:MalY/PatB family protein [Leucobacter musarum]|uniref:MalY/PatB family protein n=1 Tax=Leucobacter musarum TaxID=1930747 RepID=UPI0009E9B8B9|nr:aminotransferase class I/II-fold pyridoxal phosphate-dependent enzyme [Leucobacter musarum]
MTDADCTATTTVDPSGVPFTELDPHLLRAQRTSIKWRRFPEDVLPLFVAEMDFAIAPEVRQSIIERVEASDLGYLDQPGILAPAFARFAQDRWGWHVPHDHVHIVTDVATGVVEALRVGRPDGGRLVIPTPTYPGFFEMLEEVPFEVIEVPLAADPAGHRTGDDPVVFAAPVRLDLNAIERAFASEDGVDAFVLCNPHNPHGLAHSAADLAELARLAAAYDVFVVSDEIHAPLTFTGAQFTPFAPLAAAAGALAVTTLSASKAWNLAGAKCAVLVAADERANTVLNHLPPEAVTRVSILGLHANTIAFTESRDWLDRAIAQIEANFALLTQLVAAQLPGVRVTRPDAGYLVWLDFRAAGLGDDPYSRILHDARVAFNDGAFFGDGGAGHVRINLACAPQTIRAAVDRVSSILPAPVAPATAGPAASETSLPALDLEATR